MIERAPCQQSDELLLGDDRRFSLEHRLFNAVSLLNGLTNIGGIAGLLAIENSGPLIALNLGIGVVFAAFYAVSRFRVRYRPLCDVLRVAAARGLGYWEGTDIDVVQTHEEWFHAVRKPRVVTAPNPFASACWLAAAGNFLSSSVRTVDLPVASARSAATVFSWAAAPVLWCRRLPVGGLVGVGGRR